MRDRAANPAENKALQRLKTQRKESHNRGQSIPKLTPLDEKLVALVKALARQAAEADFGAEREQNGRTK